MGLGAVPVKNTHGAQAISHLTSLILRANTGISAPDGLVPTALYSPEALGVFHNDICVYKLYTKVFG